MTRKLAKIIKILISFNVVGGDLIIIGYLQMVMKWKIAERSQGVLNKRTPTFIPIQKERDFRSFILGG